MLSNVELIFNWVDGDAAVVEVLRLKMDLTRMKMAGPPSRPSSAQNSLIAALSKLIAISKRVVFVALFAYFIKKLVESVERLESKER